MPFSRRRVAMLCVLKRRCPPAVLLECSKPSSAQRLTVASLTCSKRATSLVVKLAEDTVRGLKHTIHENAQSAQYNTTPRRRLDMQNPDAYSPKRLNRSRELTAF